MIRKLIDRPVAVSMIVVAIIVLGIVASGILPVSLMPDVDIPKITVQCVLPGASAREIDRTVIAPLKSQLVRTTSLTELDCESKSGGGTITLHLEHGAKVDYVFIEVNEKIDYAMSSMPEGMQRPKVIKANATEIPVFFIDITAENEDGNSFIELSSFANEVVRKRLEQIPEIAMVDVSGMSGYKVVVEPYRDRLQALGLTPEFISENLLKNNVTLGSLSIKDGHYRWAVAFDREINSAEDIGDIVVDVKGRIFRISDLADIRVLPADATCVVRSDGRRAVTMAVIKQSEARMEDLDKAVKEIIEIFEDDYPGMDFKISRNQTELLEYSIGNLKSNILLGAVLAVLIIFLFLRDYRSSLLVTITIPLSLVVTLLLLYAVGVGINVISLSGLILGLGMMVDNSIIVIDNITQYRERGFGLKDAAVKGTGEVIAPMLSSVLTTCSVFIPLIFLSGMAGALFYDQAMGVTMGLFSSLAVSVLVIPVYYVLFYGKRDRAGGSMRTPVRKKDNIDYDRVYESVLKWFFRHPAIVWTVFLLCIPSAVLLFMKMDKSQLPDMTQDDVLITVDWNEPLDVEENDRRIAEFFEKFKNRTTYVGIMSGMQDFILSHTDELGSTQAQVYVEVAVPDSIEVLKRDIKEELARQYPYAAVEFSASSNIFNLIFSDGKADIVARVCGRDGMVPGPDELNAFLDRLRYELPDMAFEPVVWEEHIRLAADPEKMALYGVDYPSVYSTLKKALKRDEVMILKDGAMPVPVLLTDGVEDEYLLSKTVKGGIIDTSGVVHITEIPLYEILQERRIRDLKKLVSGRDGDYYPVEISLAEGQDAKRVMSAVEKVTKEAGDYHVSFVGGWFESRELIKELGFVLMVSILLLFFILAAQFESLIQPFIIMTEIVVDMFGALLLLWICGSSINLMSLIGLVVMSGIIINDSILKVDTINRMRKRGYGLLRSILSAGKRRLKPILMTSLTTILAIAPFLVRGNMGADLQFPLSLALIGGMTMGTLVSIFYVPLLYYEIYRRGEKRLKRQEGR